jgi:hypothetical protein
MMSHEAAQHQQVVLAICVPRCAAVNETHHIEHKRAQSERHACATANNHGSYPQ